jgi:hypothetical protein
MPRNDSDEDSEGAGTSRKRYRTKHVEEDVDLIDKKVCPILTVQMIVSSSHDSPIVP